MPAGRLVARLEGPSGVEVAFGPAGETILTAGAGGARVWDGRKFRPLTPRLHHGEGRDLLLAELSRDGTRVLTAAGDEARVWDARTGKRLLTLKHAARVWSAAFAPAGDRVVTGGADKVARVWDASTGKELTAKAHHDSVVFCTFDPDGRRVLTIAAHAGPPLDAQTRPLAHLWSADGGEDVAEAWEVDDLPREAVKGLAEGRDADLTPELVRRWWKRAAAFSPDGKRVVTIRSWSAVASTAGGDDRKSVWFQEDGTRARGAAFSRDGARLATATHTVRVWDVGRPEKPVLEVARMRWPQEAVLSTDGRRLLVAGCSWARPEDGVPALQRYLVEGDGTGVWDVASGKQLFGVATEAWHPEFIAPAIALSPDGRLAAVGQRRDGYTTIWAVPAEAGEAQRQ